MARSRSLLRRRATDREQARRGMTITFGGWMIDLIRRELTSVNGVPVRVTRAEFDPLAALVDADGGGQRTGLCVRRSRRDRQAANAPAGNARPRFRQTLPIRDPAG